MQKIIFMTVCCLAMVGCQTMQQQPQQSQAQIEQGRIQTSLRTADANFKACQSEVEKSELYSRVIKEVFFEKDDSPNKFSLLANKNKPTSEQIELVKDAMPLITKCRATVLEGLRNTPFMVVTLKYYNALDAMYIKTIRGELTIGDANEEKVKASSVRKIEWEQAGIELDTKLRAMHESEMSGRMQAAAAMMPYLMQQQNQQFQQQMLYQQQMQNIMNNRPVLTAPTTTNCSTFGNQINCTTR